MALQKKILDKVGTDKVLHFLVGALITALFSPLGWTPVIVAFFAVIFIGVVKELMIDDKADGIDILAGGLGSLFSIVFYAIERIFI